MSPIMALISLAVLAGSVLLIIGLVLRKRILIFIGAPPALLLGAWFLLASHRPNPYIEFARIFGDTNRSAASDIRTIKPTFMDGHFISFHMTPADFDARIRPKFAATDTRYSSLRLLHGQSLPKDWPKWIEMASSLLTTNLDGAQIAMLYGSQEQKAYVSVEYEQR
jgi:hypothetical protein